MNPTDFIASLTYPQQMVIQWSLQNQHLKTSEIDEAMCSRLCDLTDVIPDTVKALLDGVYDDEDGALCVCGDCGEIVPEWEECESTRFQPNGEAWSLECGHWADCPHCDTITGVEICSCSLPGGKDFDYQFKLKHFGEGYEPTLIELLETIREEQNDTPFNRWVSSGQCEEDMAGETDPQEE